MADHEEKKQTPQEKADAYAPIIDGQRQVRGLVCATTVPKKSRKEFCLVSTWRDVMCKRLDMLEQILRLQQGAEFNEARTYAIAFLAIAWGEGFKYFGQVDKQKASTCYLSVPAFDMAEPSIIGRYYYQLGPALLEQIDALKRLADFRDLVLHGDNGRFLTGQELGELIDNWQIASLAEGLMRFYKELSERFIEAGYNIGAAEVISNLALDSESASAFAALSHRKPIRRGRQQNWPTAEQVLRNLNLSREAIAGLLDMQPKAKNEEILYSMALAGAYLSFFQAAGDCGNIIEAEGDLRTLIMEANNFRTSYAHCFRSHDPLTNEKLSLNYWKSSPVYGYQGKLQKGAFGVYQELGPQLESRLAGRMAAALADEKQDETRELTEQTLEQQEELPSVVADDDGETTSLKNRNV